MPRMLMTYLTLFMMSSILSQHTHGESKAIGEVTKRLQFPVVKGSNLEGRKFLLPKDFEGKLNLVFIAFEREQQTLVDSWLPKAKLLAQSYPQLRYYELPTIARLNPISRWFIDNGMRAGIPDPIARQTTITLYLDKGDFRDALAIPDEETIYTLLVDESGEVVWRTVGEFTQTKFQNLDKTIHSLTKHSK